MADMSPARHPSASCWRLVCAAAVQALPAMTRSLCYLLALLHAPVLQHLLPAVGWGHFLLQVLHPGGLLFPPLHGKQLGMQDS